MAFKCRAATWRPQGRPLSDTWSSWTVDLYSIIYCLKIYSPVYTEFTSYLSENKYRWSLDAKQTIPLFYYSTRARARVKPTTLLSPVFPDRLWLVLCTLQTNRSLPRLPNQTWEAQLPLFHYSNIDGWWRGCLPFCSVVVIVIIQLVLGCFA